MTLSKSTGNMYDWVTHMHTHLGGECSHKCKYCYVDNPRFGRRPKYTGELRYIDKEDSVRYGEGKTIFIENCNDMFAKEVLPEWIDKIFSHCEKYPKNTYVFQTKNPEYAFQYAGRFPQNCYFGITVETNRSMIDISNAPNPLDRLLWLKKIMELRADIKYFVTIEPILDFDIEVFAQSIISVKPDFCNIGADSKNHGLPEPSKEKVLLFAQKLIDAGLNIRKKNNLERLVG